MIRMGWIVLVAAVLLLGAAATAGNDATANVVVRVNSTIPHSSNAGTSENLQGLTVRHGITAVPPAWRSQEQEDPSWSFNALLDPQTGPCKNIALEAEGQNLLCPSNVPSAYVGLRIDQKAHAGVNWQTFKSDAGYLYQFQEVTVSAGQTFASAHVPVKLVGMLNQKSNSKTSNLYCIYPSPVKLQVPAGDVLTALNKSSGSAGDEGDGTQQCWKPVVLPPVGVPTSGLPKITPSLQCSAIPSAGDALVDVPTNLRARGVTCEPPSGLVSKPATPQNKAGAAAVAGQLLRAGANALAASRAVGSNTQGTVVNNNNAWDGAATAAAKAVKLPKMNRKQWARSVAAGTALWRKQASAMDVTFLAPFRGPAQALKSFAANSPEVKIILALARGKAKETVAASEIQFSQKAIIASTVSGAVAAIAASASGQSLAATAIMPSTADNTTAVASNGLVHAQSSITVTASFAWDGDVTAGAEFDLGTTADGLTEEVLDVAAASFLNEIKTSLAYFNWEILPLPTPPVLNLQASYDEASGTVIFSAENGNYMYLLDIVSDQISSTFGIRLPDSNLATDSPVTTTTAAMIFNTNTGLQQISLGLGGSWTAQTLMQAVGASWPADNDAFTIAAPSVVYNTLPVSLQFTMLVSIPALGITNMASSLMVERESASLQLVTSFSPFQGVNVDSMSIAAVSGRELMVSATGSIASTGVSIAGQLTKNATSLTLTATNIQVVEMLREIFPSDMLPDFLLTFIEPLTFSVVTLEYNSAETGRAKLGIVAVPDINRAVALKNIIEAVGLDPTDLALRMGPSELAFGVSRTYPLSLPSPFTGPGQTSFSLAIDGVSSAIELHGRFSASLMISGIDDPIPVDVSVGIAAGATNGVSLSMSGATIAAAKFTDFPFLEVGTLSLSASVTPQPPTVNQFTLAGAVTILGSQGSGMIMFDRGTGATATQVQVENVDLQGMLMAMGVKVDLGLLNFQLHTVQASLSTVNISSLNIPAGMYFRSSVRFLGMNANTEFLMTTQGVDLTVMFNTEEFSRVFNMQVLGRIEGFINAAGDALSGAGSGLGRNREEAEKRLQEAQSKLAQAAEEVEKALMVFNEAKAKVDKELEEARSNVQNAKQAFEKARADANNALVKARQDFEAADRAFDNARDKAYDDLESAKKVVDNARKNYDDKIREANRKINEAQATVNNLNKEYNRLIDKCSWTQPGNCVAAASVWAARKVAVSVLDGARSFLNSVVNGAAKAALNTAQSSLTAAQQTANSVLTGTHWVTRQTALGVLNAAEKAANDILSGTQAVSLATAESLLTAANTAANGVLTGAHAVALESARAGLEIASAGVSAAEAAARESLEALSAALNAVGSALNSVRLANFLQLNEFGLSLTLTVQRTAIGALYDISIAGKPLSGELLLDVQNPLEAIINALAGEALKAIKASFTQIAPFLP